MSGLTKRCACNRSGAQRRALTALLIAGSLAVGLLVLPGCRLFAAPFLAWGKEPTRTILAEYPQLQNKRVLVMVWAESDTLFDYPFVQFELCEYVTHALEQHVPGVTTVACETVADLQRQNPDWDRTHPTVYAKRFDAQRVLLIELTQYGTREPDSPQLYRGRIMANVKVYDPGYGALAGPVWEPRAGALETVYPEAGPGSFGMDDMTVRVQTMDKFALELSGLFYDRQVKTSER